MTTTDPAARDDAHADLVRTARDEERPALEATESAAAAAATARAALEQLHAAEDEAWAEYSRTVDEAMQHAQSELDMAAARLRAERAASADELEHAVAQAADLVRGRIDELRVRAHLGRMDAAATASSTLDELDHALTELRQISQRIGHGASSALGDLRTEALEGMGSAVGVLRRLITRDSSS